MSKTVERLIIRKHTRVMTVLMKKDPQGNLVPVTSEEFSTGTYGDADKWEHVLKWSYPTKNRIYEADVLDSVHTVLGAADKELAESGQGGGKKYANSLPRVFDHLEIDDRDKLFRAFLEPNTSSATRTATSRWRKRATISRSRRRGPRRCWATARSPSTRVTRATPRS